MTPQKQITLLSAGIKHDCPEDSTVWGHPTNGLVVEFAERTNNGRKQTAAIAAWEGVLYALEKVAYKAPDVKQALLDLAERLK